MHSLTIFVCNDYYPLHPPPPVNTKHVYIMCTMLDQRRRRWANVVQMLYKCFVFAGYNRSYPFYLPLKLSNLKQKISIKFA